jgi:siroheme synthase
MKQRATTARQRCTLGTRQPLPQLAADRAKPPALAVVGEVAALQPELARGMRLTPD